MHKLIILFMVISLSSQGQYLKHSTLAASGNIKGLYAWQVIGQSSVVAGSTRQARQGFKQPFGQMLKTSISNMLSMGEPVNWSVETFPNPFVDRLTVRLNKSAQLPTRLILYDMNAQLIWEGVYDETSFEMNLEHLKGFPVGKYLLQVFHNGKSQTKTLIKSIQ